MFNVTADLLKSILILRSSEQTRGAWLIFVKELRKIRDRYVSENLHFVPSSDDINARYRRDIMNGIAICMDVLTNSLEDPDSLLEDMRKITEQTELNKNAPLF
jgi:hypothetical protein